MSCGVFAARQRQTRDVFQGDPFKIQSYNFRYAERPVYPLQQYPRPEPQPLYARPQTETFYYNSKFKTDTNEIRPIPTPVTTSAFTEHRRRKFLHDFKCIPTPPRKMFAPIITCQRSASVAPQPRRMLSSNPPATATNSPLLRSCCHRGEYQMTRRGQSTTSLIKSSSTNVLRTEAGGGGATANKGLTGRSASDMSFINSKSYGLHRKRSTCSGCEININISGLDSDTDTDNNVRIKIETDSASLRNNTDKVQKSTSPPSRSSSTNRSRVNFGIDKRLSKFNMMQKEITCNNDRDRDYLQRRQQKEEEERREREQQRERALQRERERERLRELERQRDRDHLLQLEAERERDRLRLLERENQRQLEFERINRYREQQRREVELRVPMRAVPMPSPVIMTSHLYRPDTEDRLPGMMPFYERKSAPLQTQTKRAQRLQNLNSTGGVLKKPTYQQTKSQAASASPNPCLPPGLRTASASPPLQRSNSTYTHNLDRRSSGTSNGNVHVVITTSPSNASLRRLSATRLNEHKPLNSNKVVCGSQNSPIHTRINNMPIRITTSRPADKDAQFSINRIRLRNSSPMPGEGSGHRRSSTRLEDVSGQPYNVSINVYGDHLRMLRL